MRERFGLNQLKLLIRNVRSIDWEAWGGKIKRRQRMKPPNGEITPWRVTISNVLEGERRMDEQIDEQTASKRRVNHEGEKEQISAIGDQPWQLIDWGNGERTVSERMTLKGPEIVCKKDRYWLWMTDKEQALESSWKATTERRPSDQPISSEWHANDDRLTTGSSTSWVRRPRLFSQRHRKKRCCSQKSAKNKIALP